MAKLLDLAFLLIAANTCLIWLLGQKYKVKKMEGAEAKPTRQVVLKKLPKLAR